MTDSAKVHDRYVRRPIDLPWRGRTARLILTVRRFRCCNLACKRRTFAEDCGPNLPRYARRTLEANSHLLQLARTAGGEAGARLAKGEGIPISPDTLLRLLRHAGLPAFQTPRVLDVDDFALRRRQRYGTILLDLESHRPIDLFEGRDANTLANWLKAHPGVEVISRDRSGAYAEGARVGAPEAVQIADRFHLLQNASAALDGMLRGRRLGVEEMAVTTVASVSAEPVGEESPITLSPTKRYQAERQEARIERWKQVKVLAKAGASIRHISREVGVSRKTVRHLIATPEPPVNQVVHRRPGGLQSPTLQPYVTYLQDRWEAGCTNVAKLFREIGTQGYVGSRSLLAQAVASWRSPRLPKEQRQKVRRLTRRLSMRWICLRPPASLNDMESILLAKVLSKDADLALGHELLQKFREVMEKRDIVALEGWLESAKSSNLSTYVALANGIEADRAAVNAALTSPWSNGPTEGHINRLK